jgi:hypothetical protein
VKNVRVVASVNSGASSAVGTLAHVAASARRTGASAGQATSVGSMSSPPTAPGSTGMAWIRNCSLVYGSSGPSSAAPTVPGRSVIDSTNCASAARAGSVSPSGPSPRAYASWR